MNEAVIYTVEQYRRLRPRERAYGAFFTLKALNRMSKEARELTDEEVTAGILLGIISDLG